MEYWKLKLSHIVHSTQFCGICLSSKELVSTVNDQIEIVVQDVTYSRTLADIVDVVFKEAVNLVNAQICNSCTKKLIHSYMFIQQAQDTLNILNKCLNDLYYKTSYIHNNFFNYDCSNLSKVIIALDRNNFEENIINDRQIKEEKTIEKEKAINARKRKFKCLTCNIILPSYKAWSLHQTTHNNKHKCKRCSKTFKTQKQLINHNKSHYKLRCKICLRLVKDGELLEHLKEYHEHSSRLCSICFVAFYSVKDLAAHNEEWHYSDVSKCLTCLKSYTEAELEEHQCRFGCNSCAEAPCVHNKYLMCYRRQILNGAHRLKCLDCQYVCLTKDALLNHVNINHLYNIDKSSCDSSHFLANVLNRDAPKKDSKCQYCDVEFADFELYNSHVKNCDSKTLKNVCEASTDMTKIYTNVKQEIFPCGLCNRIFPNDSTRIKHMIQSHSGKKKQRAVILDCVVCQEKFSTKGDLINHMKSHGPDDKYPCRVCNTQYETLRQYRAHNRKHIGPFAVCEVCGKEMRQTLLKKHMTTHSESAVTCKTCGKSFQSIVLLKYHQKVHLESVPCPKCNKMINPAKLRRHYKNHIIQENPDLKAATKQTPNLKCELCDYKTWNNILLECHMNRHHLKVKPYICHVCSKAFIGKHLLKKHIDTHTVEKTVVCMICMKNFANAACLKMHLRLHTGERPFTCEICGDRFRSSSILNVHKLKKHSDKNSSCPLCQNKFHTVRDLRRHIIKVHWKEKEKKFDPRELSGLGEEHYHLFHDGRRVKVDEEDLEFYVP